MINPVRATRGIAVAPHAMAAQSASAVLRDDRSGRHDCGGVSAHERYRW
jgi:hypothetical protein